MAIFLSFLNTYEYENIFRNRRYLFTNFNNTYYVKKNGKMKA